MTGVGHLGINIPDEEKSDLGQPGVKDSDNVEVNAAGYKDQLKRQYSLSGIVGIALTVDNAWAALGSSISVSIRKSGSPCHDSALS